ncbi:MAG: tRNA (adenosine(37)-N6)-dimethylallyltransferase MiaA [Pseudomonadaceae bacterium]|nr:tRNA (adenosine(37)-N6)-dimethylallyltransferase MiaA [Pseudomonadaceae bacterium]
MDSHAGAPRRVLCLLGATAAGKTELAFALADARPCRLISVDSAQVYRGLDIGSAKPDQQTLQRYPHELIDIREPDDVYSAADFVRDADAACERAFAADELPVLVGGTMLYARGFRDGIAELPEADPQLRQALMTKAQRVGWLAMHAELTRLDPAVASGIHPNNHQRVLRALEVLELSGALMSEQWRASGKPASDRLSATLHQIALDVPERAQLHRRIEDRFRAMLDAGLLDEVASLLERFDPELPALRSVGYRQSCDYLRGHIASEAELFARGCAATRQLAKRQLTWLRSWPDLNRLPSAPAAGLAADVLQTLDNLP